MARLVIIDDEASILELMTKYCRSLGHEVTGCQSGTEGLAAVRKIRPEVVVVDLKLGDVDGLEIIKICRSEVPSAAVIMITGHGSVETAVEAMRLGAFDYLSKPFDLPDLQRAIDTAGIDNHDLVAKRERTQAGFKLRGGVVRNQHCG